MAAEESKDDLSFGRQLSLGLIDSPEEDEGKKKIDVDSIDLRRKRFSES